MNCRFNSIQYDSVNRAFQNNRDTDSSSFNTASQSHILTQAVPIFVFRFRFCQKASKFGGLLTSVQEVFAYTSFQYTNWVGQATKAHCY